MDLKSLLIKVKDFFSKVKAFLKNAVALVKEFGFGVVNFILIVLLGGFALGNVNTPGFVLVAGGFWAVFIAGRAIYWVYKGCPRESDREPL